MGKAKRRQQPPLDFEQQQTTDTDGDGNDDSKKANRRVNEGVKEAGGNGFVRKIIGVDGVA